MLRIAHGLQTLHSNIPPSNLSGEDPLSLQNLRSTLSTYSSIKAAIKDLLIRKKNSSHKSQKSDQPLLCLFPQTLQDNARAFLDHFNGSPAYAVKSDPSIYTLSTLINAGIRHFDVASLGEVRLLHSLDRGARLSFMNPVKSPEAIEESYFLLGVREFVLDSFDELEKILAATNNAKDLTLIVRIKAEQSSAACPLAKKFGIDSKDAPELLRRVARRAKKVGLSFHVGSQTLDPKSYVKAIQLAGHVLHESGVTPDIFDVGGGFPVPHLGMEIPPLQNFFTAIDKALKKPNLPETCEIWAEPGRALSATGKALVVRVELRRKGNVVHLNDGCFGNMFEIGSMNWKNDIKVIRYGKNRTPEPSAPFLVWGPSCDSVDVMRGLHLPADIRGGDHLVIYGAGSYTDASRSHFNGFGDSLTAIIDPSRPSSWKMPPKMTLTR